MNHRVSKFTCLLLALLMVCTLLPATVFAEGGEANAAKTPAAVQAFLSAVEAISIPEEISDETGPALNEQIGAAQDAYDALSEEELAREDVQAAVEKLSAAMDALTGGAEPAASYTWTVKMRIMEISDDYNLGYSFASGQTSRSYTVNSAVNNWVTTPSFNTVANEIGYSMKDGYELKGLTWSQTPSDKSKINLPQTNPNREFSNVYVTSNNYTVWYVVQKTAPTYYSYTVNHVYRTNGVQDGTYTQSFQAEAGTTVSASNITKRTTYNNNTYTYTSATPTSANITGNGTTFTLYYDRTVETKPDAPTSDEVTKLLNNAVKVDCTNTEVSHADKTYGLINESFTIGNVEGNADSGYTVKVTVKPAKYVDAYNTDIATGHTLVDGQDSKTITLKYHATTKAWEAVSTIPVTFTVVCETVVPVPKPDEPKLSDLANVTVYLLCRNVDGHKQVFPYNDDTAALFAGAVTFGKVEKDESGNYICTATMSAAPFLEELNKTNPGHSIAEGSEGPRVLGTLYYNGDTGEWNLESSESGQVMLRQVFIYVTCSDDKPQGPTFEQISNRLFVELNCTNDSSHSVYFKEEPFTAGAHNVYKGKLIEGSTTASDVEWDAALGAWVCDVTVDAKPYCEVMNEGGDLWHHFADSQRPTEIVKMRYTPDNHDKPWSVVPEQRMAIQDDVVYPVKFDVICEESTSTPDAPTVANVGLGSVTLVCDRVKAHDKRFDVLESSVQIGKVQQDAAGLYTCDVTVQAAPYLAELNKTSPVHRLANGESGQASWTMYYRNGNWVSDETGGLKIRHISFRVICDAAAPVYPKEYCYIDATATGGGSISPRGTVRVPVYDDQTFYMLAEPGYALVDVLVDGVSVGAVGSYTFRSVTRHHTIHAVFQPLSALPPQTGGDSTAVLFLGMGLILTACAAFVCLYRRKEN